MTAVLRRGRKSRHSPCREKKVAVRCRHGRKMATQGQRLELCCHRPRNTLGNRSLTPPSLQREQGPADILTLDFWPLLLRRTHFCFKATTLVVPCYRSPRKLPQAASTPEGGPGLESSAPVWCPSCTIQDVFCCFQYTGTHALRKRKPYICFPAPQTLTKQGTEF